MMHYDKNESKIKILKIPIVLVKISKTSILDHIYIGPHIYMAQCKVNSPKHLKDGEIFF